MDGRFGTGNYPQENRYSIIPTEIREQALNDPQTQAVVTQYLNSSISMQQMLVNLARVQYATILELRRELTRYVSTNACHAHFSDED